MRGLLFFSRVALLCNICFITTLLMRYMPLLPNGAVYSTIIILGVIAVILNALTFVTYLFVNLARKSIDKSVPAWIIVVNFLFFVAQIIFLVK